MGPETRSSDTKEGFNQLNAQVGHLLFCSLLSVVAVSGGPDELLQAEGTVILHITFALKQDQACSVNVVFSIYSWWVLCGWEE